MPDRRGGVGGVVVPGDRVGHCTDTQHAGEGTFVRHQRIFAAVCGRLRTTRAQNGAQILYVETRKGQVTVPQVGSVILGKVHKVNSRQATVDIIAVNGKALQEAFQGIINTKDVRLTEIDKVEMAKCFRPGDVIQAEVFSLGDSRSFYLTTAKDEYGVVYATSVAGAPMAPVSWEEMQCTETQMCEPRKVARVEIPEGDEEKEQVVQGGSSAP